MVKHLFPYLLAALLLPTLLFSQEKINLHYYLPNVAYDATIPTPARYLGYEVGEWHASHDQLVAYMRVLAESSPRVRLQEYGRSHENRPLICLTITAPANHDRVEAIKAARQGLRTGKTAPEQAVPVAYMGYSIHGNEASGTNAALMVAYYLAAAQTDEVKQLLEKNVILLDPCFNPDGMQRFSSWVNSRRSKSLIPDPNHDEFNETWPGGRTNHYWFDLNRDWLVCQQPESGGRVSLFQEWLPNILTDHHEMGSNATFFFQPGVPSRVNPLTPARNQELTGQIAQYHAKILSDKKILFFTGENYDDFYYGKGSTYPDIQGAVGILFEQGSSRGSAQETDNGLLTFPYSIRNQVLTSLSTLQALRDMGGTLNAYLHEFYRNAEAESQREANAGYLIGTQTPDRYPLQALVDVLYRHKVQLYPLTKETMVNGKKFRPDEAFFIPFEQTQYRLIKGMFGRPLSFQDSIFYDIAAWTLPDAYGVAWTTVGRSVNIARAATPLEKSSICNTQVAVLPNAQTAYAYAVHPDAYETPKLLAELLRRNVRVRVALKPFRSDTTRFAAGTLVVAFDRQNGDPTAISQLLGQSGCRIAALGNGFTPEGPDLGSSNFPTVRAPKVALLTGRSINPADAGEVWHLLDTRYGLPPVLLDVERVAQGASLSKYNVVVLADGSPNAVVGERLKEFVTDGGTLIATGTALRWVKAQNLLSVEFRSGSNSAAARGQRAYAQLTDDNGAYALPGAILEAQMDLTHPICFGYTQARIPMFLGDAIFPDVAQNPYATPVVFTQTPLLAGYMHASQKPLVQGAAAVLVGSLGRGRVIGFTSNPNFRAFWYGTNRLFANAVFFGNLINAEATERKR